MRITKYFYSFRQLTLLSELFSKIKFLLDNIEGKFFQNVCLLGPYISDFLVVFDGVLF